MGTFEMAKEAGKKGCMKNLECQNTWNAMMPTVCAGEEFVLVLLEGQDQLGH